MIAVPDAILYLVYTDMAQHDTIQHGPRLHTIIIRGVGWAFEQNGGGKNPLAAARILWRLCLYSVPVGFVVPVLDSPSKKARAV